MPLRLARLSLLVPAILLLVAAAFACDGDDDDTDTGAPTSPGATRTRTPTGTSTPLDTGDEKSPPPEETHEPTETPESGEPTAPPPATEGTPAKAPEDEGAFLAQFQGRAVTQEECFYNPSTRLTTCPDRGDYAVDPPLVGEDISCSLLIVDGKPEAVQCRSANPVRSQTYDIQ